MLDPALFLAHWGYAALVAVVVLGNLGLPVPEEAVLVLTGYLVWDGHLQLPAVLLLGIASAVLGDNLGYWLGRTLGRPALERYGHRLAVTPARLDAAQQLVTRFGAWAVAVARFLPGLRFLAGPVAGITGLPPARFFAANLCGAALYVPAAVAVGYGLGYGLQAQIGRVEQVVGRIEHAALLAILIAIPLLLLARRLRNPRHP